MRLTGSRSWLWSMAVAVVVTFAGPVAVPPASGGPAPVDHWRTVRPMHTARTLHTATLLQDGRVLVTGGRGASAQPLASAEIYNPAADRWRRVAPMRHARSSHVAVRLQGHRVLVVGGGAVPEIYNPRTDRWRSVTPIERGNGASTATLMSDGRVFVFGGSPDCSGTPVIYAPATSSWTEGASVAEVDPVVPCAGSSVLLEDGRVLLHGGVDNNQGSGFTGSHLYDPDTDSWALPAAAPVEFLHMDFGLVRLTTGDVLLAGGTCRLCSGGQRSTFVFDPVASAWNATAPMNAARQNHVLAALPGGRALAAGGFEGDGFLEPQLPSRSAEVYDAASDTWSRTSDMHADHATGTTATTLRSGRVLVVGGGNINAPSATAFAELYRP